jgi:hypothetical protein
MKRTCPVSCSDMKRSPRRNECIDTHENCPIWFEAAECETNDSVKKYCPLSCGRCGNTGSNEKKETRESGTASARNKMEGTKLCEDNHENCSGWAVRKLMIRFIIFSCDLCDKQSDHCRFFLKR